MELVSAEQAANGDQDTFVTRSYQQEMLAESMKRNIIVAMDTGSGKTYMYDKRQFSNCGASELRNDRCSNLYRPACTHNDMKFRASRPVQRLTPNRAVLRIRAELERMSTEKLVWFIAPSVALCFQQYEVLRHHLPAFQCRVLCGEDDVDRWSTQTLWDAVLKNIRVVVSTPKVLLDALENGFVRLKRLGLIVFDEAHRCVKKNPGNQIMQLFYHEILQQDGPTMVPAILGLTASPVMNANPKGLIIIERNLNAVSKTPRICRTELMKHVFRPELHLATYINEVPFPSGNTRASSLRNRLQDAFLNYDFASDPYILELRARGDFLSAAKAEKAIADHKTWCYLELKGFYSRAEDVVLKELGWWAFEWYVHACITRFRSKGTEKAVDWMSTASHERDHLGSILDSIHPSESTTPFFTAEIQFGVSSKVEKLINILVNESDDPFIGIVFAKQRVTVAALSQILSCHPQTRQRFALGAFVGTSSYSSKKRSVCELADIKVQQEVLEDFREGKRNLVISTSVLEEGIDVSACNAVICFDAPDNLVSFVQRRGRARKKESKYIIFETDELDISKWSTLEDKMREAYLNDERQIQNEVECENIDEEGERQMRIESTGALLTLDNAISRLYHFCQTISSGSHISPHPEFSYEVDPNTKLLRASVCLPLAVEQSVRRAESANFWKTERNARKDAAFSACVALHQKGLINDNLMPLLADEELNGTELTARQESIVLVSACWNPWEDVARSWTTAESYHSSAITIRSTDRDTPTIARMILPIVAPNIPEFNLYLNNRVTYTARPEAWPNQLEFDKIYEELSIARDTTHILLDSVMPSRMKQSGDGDFVALFVPSEASIKSNNWNEAAKGTWTVEEVQANLVPDDHLGLVTDCRQEYATYFYRGFAVAQPTRLFKVSSGPAEENISPLSELPLTPAVQSVSFRTPSPPEDELCLKTLRVPKRRDFLHRLSSPAVSTDSPLFKYLPARCCTFNKLPERYSTFALFIPSIMHQFELHFIAEELRNTVLSKLELGNIDLVLAAICASSAREESNYQKLEFIGDCILKLCTCLHLLVARPMWPAKYLTIRKSQMVANTTLSKIALRFGLDKFIITEAFTSKKWRPKYINDLLMDTQRSREMSTKVLADVVESLIGASFMDGIKGELTGDLEKSLECIKLFFPTVKWQTFHDLHTILYDRIADADCCSSYLLEIEALVGYTFNRKSIILEAMTHASLRTDMTAQPYERIEFAGDAILDYLVVVKLLQHGAGLRHQQLHTLRTALVNADFLAFLGMELYIEQEQSEIVQDPMTKTFSTINMPIRKVLWQFMRNGPDIIKSQQAATERHDALREGIIEAFKHGPNYPWALLASTRAEKFFSDIIESTLAAIYIDSKGNVEVCFGFLERLGILPYLRRAVQDGVHMLHPKEQLGQLADSEVVVYEVEVEDGAEKGYKCKVFVGERLVASIDGGVSKFQVEVLAAEKAVQNWANLANLD